MKLPVQYNTPDGEVNAFGAIMFILTASAMVYFIISTHGQIKNNKQSDALGAEIENLKNRVKVLESNNL